MMIPSDLFLATKLYHLIVVSFRATVMTERITPRISYSVRKFMLPYF